MATGAQADPFHDQAKLSRFLDGVDSIPALTGAGVELSRSGTTETLRRSDASPATVIVIEARAPDSTPGDRATEWVGVGLNCGATVLSAMAASASAGGTVISFGAMAPLTALATAGAAASAFQCGASITRLANTYGDNPVFNPGNNSYLDTDEGWKDLNYVLDWVGLASGIGLGIAAAPKYATLAKYAKNSAALSALSRAERKVVMKQLVKEIDDVTKSRAFREWVAAQGVNATFSRAALTTIAQNQLKGELATLLGIVGSAKAANSGDKSAAGDIYSGVKYIMHIVQKV